MNYLPEKSNLNGEMELPQKAFTFCMVAMIVLNTYTIGPVAFGEILMISLFVILISKVDVRHSSFAECVFFLFVGYSFIITALNVFKYNLEYQSPALRMLRDAFYLVLIFVFAKRFFNYQYAVRLMNILAVILSLYILVQFFAYLLLGVYVPGVVPGLNVSGRSYDDIKYSMTVTASILGYIRPNGFLAEPSNCGQFLVLVLLIDLFERNITFRIQKITLIVIAILCTTSANGIVLMLLVFLFSLFTKVKRPSSQIQLRNVLIIGWLLSIIALIMYIRIDFIQNIVQRLILLGSRTQGSGAIRVLRGYMFYKELPFSEKLFGIGFGNFVGIKNALNINTAYEYDVEYMNMNAYLLVSSGVIGITLILLALYCSLAKKNIVGVGSILLLVTMGMSSSVYSTAVFALYLSIYFHCNQSLGNREYEDECVN